MSIKIVDAIIQNAERSLGVSSAGHIEYCKRGASSTIKINNVEYKFENIRYYAIYDGRGNLISFEGNFTYIDKIYEIKVSPYGDIFVRESDDKAADWFNARVDKDPNGHWKNEYVIL